MNKQTHQPWFHLFTAVISLTFLLSGCQVAASSSTATSSSTSSSALDVNLGQDTTESQNPYSDYIMAAGNISAKDTRNIVLNFPASVSDVPVSNGQEVKKGDILISLDTSDYKHSLSDLTTNIDQAQLQLDLDQSQLDAAKNNLALARTKYNDLSSDTSSVDLKQSAYDHVQDLLTRAQSSLEDDQSLYESGVISSDTLDTAKDNVTDLTRTLNDDLIALNTAKTSRTESLATLENAVVSAQSQVDQLQTTINIQKNQIASLQDDYDQENAYLNADYMDGSNVISTMDHGLVQNLTLDSGDYLSAKSPLLSLIDMDSLQVDAYVLEDYINDIHVGSLTHVHLISDDSLIYDGQISSIDSISTSLNNETMYHIEVSLDNIDDRLKLNEDVDVYIEP